MKSKKVFAEVLADLRSKAGLSWREVARGTGITPSMLSGYINGAHYPRVENYEKIACFFNISSHQLQELEGLKLAETVTKERRKRALARLEVVAPEPAQANGGQIDGGEWELFSRPLPDSLPEQLAELEELWAFHQSLQARWEKLMMEHRRLMRALLERLR